MGIFSNTYYGNTMQEWGIAFLIALCVIILGKVLYWIAGSIIKKFASKTKTKLDDILIDMLEEPLVFAVALVGIWYAFSTLSLSEGISAFIAKAFMFIIVLNVAWFLTRLFGALYKEYLIPMAAKSENDLDDQLFPLLSKGVKAIVWALAILIGLNNAGFDIGAVLAGLGIGGLALAMAAKDTIANIFGGFTIFSDGLFKIKDRIKAAGHDGVVEEIGLRSTKIRTLEGRLVTIPNKEFAAKPVENVSTEPSRKVVLNLGLTYDTDEKGMATAKKIVESILAKHDGVNKKVLTSFNGFGDFALNLLVIYYIKKGSNILDTQTDVNMEILKQFNKNKLEFAFPTQTIYTKK